MKLLVAAALAVMLMAAPAAGQEVTTSLSGEFMRGTVNVDIGDVDETGSMILLNLETIMVDDFSIGLLAGQGEIAGVDEDNLNQLEIYGKYNLAPEIMVRAGYKNLSIHRLDFQGLNFGGQFSHDFDPQMDLIFGVNYLPFLRGEYDGSDRSATGFEANAGIEYLLFDGLNLAAGYRTMRYTLDDEDIDAGFSGIYVGVGHTF